MTVCEIIQHIYCNRFSKTLKLYIHRGILRYAKPRSWMRLLKNALSRATDKTTSSRKEMQKVTLQKVSSVTLEQYEATTEAVCCKVDRKHKYGLLFFLHIVATLKRAVNVTATL